MTANYRFHILGLPHTVSSKEYNACAYTQKVVKFGKMMISRGHEIIHYGHEDSDLVCTEHVTVTTNKDLEIAYGDHDWRKNFYRFDVEDHAYQTFYTNAIREVGLRKQPHDFILPFWGSGVRPVCDAHPDLICVEPGIGYAGGHWARWKIFESYAIYHAYCGLQNVSSCRQDWYDAVIPNYFDPDDFEFRDKKQNYFLFLGRVYSGKGIDIAIQATEASGDQLIIAGQNPENLTFPPHVQFIGYADVDLRRQLMAGAKGAFVASTYLEPFGGVQMEMLFSGTPTITTDWGSFAENNLHGITGYRCRTFEQFVWAAKNIHRIDPHACRAWAENFSLHKVALMYEEYFKTVMDVHTGRGWYEPNPNRFGFSSLQKNYPQASSPMEYDVIVAEEKPWADRLAVWIKQELDPKSVLDIGCGPGLYVDSLIDQGVDATGIDIDDRVENRFALRRQSLFDLEDEQADVVLCMEVAEHLPASQADQMVEQVCNTVNGALIWTAAVPGQQGHGHINLQEPAYWEEKILRHGLKRNKDRENQLLNYARSGLHMGWFVNNLLYFERQSH
jgi:glycosyltransferase involved in cell wall biosynthesis